MKGKGAMMDESALGIWVGNLVSTSYGTGPYVVRSIGGPVLFRKGLDIIVYPMPVVCLSLSYAKGHRLWDARDRAGKAYINDIYRDGERWFGLAGDEIFVASGNECVQLGLFNNRVAMPYVFQSGVDYEAGHQCVWHCERCGLDFNWDGRGCRYPPNCTACDWIASTRIIMVCKGASAYVQGYG